jgi:hypothetical protein
MLERCNVSFRSANEQAASARNAIKEAYDRRVFRVVEPPKLATAGVRHARSLTSLIRDRFSFARQSASGAKESLRSDNSNSVGHQRLVPSVGGSFPSPQISRSTILNDTASGSMCRSPIWSPRHSEIEYVPGVSGTRPKAAHDGTAFHAMGKLLGWLIMVVRVQDPCSI